MFKINKLRVEILTDKSENINDLYGFEFSFNQGFNIIAGPNSRGKTTINSCIYYALGMEELLGAHNEKALDKALKEEFSIHTHEEVNYKVQFSKVLLEIENDQKKISCLERYIKVNNDGSKTTNIGVYHSTLENLYVEKNTNTAHEIYFLNSRGNNDDPNGFYSWLGDFAGLVIPSVSNSSRSSKYSPLYLQIVFSALFIEQTKGWSEFFATMPFFGVTKAKEKIIEFLLDLNEISLSTQKDILNRDKDLILEQWTRKVKSFSYLEKQSNSTIINIPQALTIDKTQIEKISVVFSRSEEEEEKISLPDIITEKEILVRELENKPLTTIKENREEAILEYNTQKNKYSELKNYVDKFENKLNIEFKQLDNLNTQLNIINSEIKDHLNLKKVFSENIINERGANHCPTCSQEVSTNLISTKNIRIPQLTLDENTNFLRSQKKLIESSLLSLKSTINEKEVLLSYFQNSIREKEILIKSISKDLISDDRAFSESDIVRKLQLEREIENLTNLRISVADLKSDLENLATKYHNNTIKINNLGESEKEDEKILEDFEKSYKDLLFNFGYESNEKFKISINRKEPFKYFPVYKRFKDDTLPQSIRINSSASDFVRNIWAYTLSLLIRGNNHPGLVLFDEPGQHRTNLNSLKELFKSCSHITDRQTIIFTSIDKQFNDEGEKLDLEILINGLNKSNYNLIQLDNVQKVIRKL
ncbi:AAA family ATPase [Pedobacter gandavensis]|uniref:AAA family ATPase n=1 Tax=Pedobacter gandavensis TaxID=2679963 RepID=UPI00292FBD62|nr:AAA family ATPase [Pedobacter gandavensis]